MITKMLTVVLGVVAILTSSCTPVPESRLPQVHYVFIKEMLFQPSEITVMKGDTIQWFNNDIVAHNVRELKSNAWTSPTLASGDSWKMVVTKSEEYYCSIHVVMKGRIIIN